MLSSTGRLACCGFCNSSDIPAVLQRAASQADARSALISASKTHQKHKAVKLLACLKAHAASPRSIDSPELATQQNAPVQCSARLVLHCLAVSAQSILQTHTHTDTDTPTHSPTRPPTHPHTHPNRHLASGDLGRSTADFGCKHFLKLRVRCEGLHPPRGA